MDPKSRKEISDYYSGRLKEFGPVKESLVYSSEEQQVKRYALLASIEPLHSTSSVLDVGCGLGYFVDFLRSHGWNGSYTGLDICEDMISAASKLHPEDTFYCQDILDNQYTAQFNYVFCGATVEHRPPFGDPTEYLKKMIAKMYALCNQGVAFDVFSSRVDYQDNDKLYIDPLQLLDFCHDITPRFKLSNEARPFELMMYLYKQHGYNDLHIYDDWCMPEIRVIEDEGV